MMVTDMWDLTDRDRAIIRLRELKEEKFLRESEFNRSNTLNAFSNMLMGILMLALTLVFCLLAVIYSDKIVQLFEKLLG